MTDMTQIKDILDLIKLLKQASNSPREVKEDTNYWIKIVASVQAKFIKLRNENPKLDFNKLLNIVNTEVNRFFYTVVPILETRSIMNDKEFMKSFK